MTPNPLLQGTASQRRCPPPLAASEQQRLTPQLISARLARDLGGEAWNEEFLAASSVKSSQPVQRSLRCTHLAPLRSRRYPKGNCYATI